MADCPLQVLIVEDEPLIAMVLEHAVVSADRLVVGWAADRASALAIADAHTPNVAFVDLRLRDGETGPEISRYLSAKGVAVVITTAHPGDLVDLGRPLGIVPKPYSPETIEAVLRYVTQKLEGTDVEPLPPPGFYSRKGAAPAVSARLKPPTLPEPLPQPPLKPNK